METLFAKFRFDSSGAPVGYQSVCIERAEVGPSSDVARMQFQPKAKRFDHAPADLVHPTEGVESVGIALLGGLSVPPRQMRMGLFRAS